MGHFLRMLCLFFRSDLTSQDPILKIRVLASLGFPCGENSGFMLEIQHRKTVNSCPGKGGGEGDTNSPGEKKAHKHKLSLDKRLVVPRLTGPKSLCVRLETQEIECSPSTRGCPDFQKVYVFKVYVPFSCPKFGARLILPDCFSAAPSRVKFP